MYLRFTFCNLDDLLAWLLVFLLQKHNNQTEARIRRKKQLAIQQHLRRYSKRAAMWLNSRTKPTKSKHRPSNGGRFGTDTTTTTTNNVATNNHVPSVPAGIISNKDVSDVSAMRTDTTTKATNDAATNNNVRFVHGGSFPSNVSTTLQNKRQKMSNSNYRLRTVGGFFPSSGSLNNNGSKQKRCIFIGNCEQQ